MTFVLTFLDHLERARKNSIRSRSARLAALRSFLRFAALKDPQSLAMIQRVLAIPLKRHSRPMIGFLSRQEIQAILGVIPINPAAVCQLRAAHNHRLYI